MLIKKPDDIKPSDITDESVYKQRRRFLKQAIGVAALGGAWLAGKPMAKVIPKATTSSQTPKTALPPQWLEQKIIERKTPSVIVNEKLTPYSTATSYNNFYEFGSSKEDPKRLSSHFKPYPWSVIIDGEVKKPGTYHLEDFIKPYELQDRIYRLRCVEAWSMVIPWVGIPLVDLIKRFEPTGAARYVSFTSLLDPQNLPGQASRWSLIKWPYQEGLRLDEAMHPLTLLAVGIYGKTLPAQNGAPLRLVVPWKYGFKSIKSIVRIHLSKTQPQTTWQTLAPSEYGFYANVNPSVAHPRWSQKTERRLPGRLLGSNRIKTQLFNGYAEQVASLYQGMDLVRDY